jgi:hypothetical protein
VDYYQRPVLSDPHRGGWAIVLPRPDEPVAEWAGSERPAVDPAVPYSALEVVDRAVVQNVQITFLNLTCAGALEGSVCNLEKREVWVFDRQVVVWVQSHSSTST